MSVKVSEPAQELFGSEANGLLLFYPILEPRRVDAGIVDQTETRVRLGSRSTNCRQQEREVNVDGLDLVYSVSYYTAWSSAIIFKLVL